MKRKGFTLIELLVVISIIGVLATLVIGELKRSRDRATDVVMLRKAKEFQKAVEIFNIDNNRYPTAGTINIGFTGGNPVAGTCGNASFEANWDSMVADMGNYLADFFAGTGDELPLCMFYTISPSNQCEHLLPETYEYAIAFGTLESEFGGLGDVFHEVGEQFHCIYEI